MIANEEMLADLALGYINGRLSAKDREKVQELIISNREFLAILKDEISFKKQMQPLKPTLPTPVKNRVYQKVAADMTIKVCQALVYNLLAHLAAPIPSPVLKLLQRSVFSNE